MFISGWTITVVDTVYYTNSVNSATTLIIKQIQCTQIELLCPTKKKLLKPKKSIASINLTRIQLILDIIYSYRHTMVEYIKTHNIIHIHNKFKH